MAERTIKQKIQDYLENLSEKDFKKFVLALVDRRAEPRILTRRVEGKDFMDVTNVIVTTYGEAQAVEVVCEVLRVCAIDATNLETVKMVPVPDGPDLRIVIIGGFGSGKSATGNTILGEKRFKAKIMGKPQTKTCEEAVTRWGNRQISVVDTPDIFDSEDIVKREMLKSLKLSCPGPHAFLLALKIGPFTEAEKHSVEHLQELFGPEVSHYMLVLFTNGDLLDDTTIEEFLSEYQDLQQIISKCGNRFHVFNNKSKDRRQVVDLIKKIDVMVAGNGGRYYTDNKTVAVKGLQDFTSALENLQRAVSNASCITSCQVTFNLNLGPTDNDSSHIAWGRNGANFLPSAGSQRFCLQVCSVQILLDVRSRFIEGMSGPVLMCLLDKLFEKRVLNHPERESADEMQNRGDKARLVIDTVRRKGEAASSEMIQVLCEVDPFLCEYLGLIHRKPFSRTRRSDSSQSFTFYL